jgi:hypothetical protein
MAPKYGGRRRQVVVNSGLTTNKNEMNCNYNVPELYNAPRSMEKIEMLKQKVLEVFAFLKKPIEAFFHL